MSNVVKWGLLAAGVAVLVGLVMVLPVSQYLNFGELGTAISGIVNVCSSAFSSARGLINCFLTPFGRTCLSGLLSWLFGKWAITTAVKIVAWSYHFIFRG